MATKKKETHKVKPSELQKELDDVYGIIKKYPEVKPTAVHLISMLKSEFEGRGVPDNLNRMCKAFKAMVDSLKESETNG